MITNEGNIRYSGFDSAPKENTASAMVFTYHHKEDKITSFISKPTENNIYPISKGKIPTISDPFPNGKPSTLFRTIGDEIFYAGVYRDTENNEAGVFLGRYDLANNSFSKWTEVPFSEKMLTKIKTNKKGKVKSKTKGDIVIKELLVKDNNDVILLFELENTQTDLVNFGNPNQEESIQIDLDSRDILYFNFNPQTEFTYSGVIKKHQKNGIADQASFVATSIVNTTHILFNSLEGSSSRLMQFSINEDGSEVSEKEVFNPDRKLITPKKITLPSIHFGRSFMATGTSNLLMKEKGELLIEGMDDKRSTLVKIKL